MCLCCFTFPQLYVKLFVSTFLDEINPKVKGEIMQDFLDRQWTACLSDLSKKISSVGMDLWINPLQPINIDGNRLVVVAPNEMSKEQIYSNYLKRMKEALKEHFNLEEVLVLLPDEKDEYIEKFNNSHNGPEISKLFYSTLSTISLLEQLTKLFMLQHEQLQRALLLDLILFLSMVALGLVKPTCYMRSAITFGNIRQVI